MHSNDIERFLPFATFQVIAHVAGADKVYTVGVGSPHQRKNGKPSSEFNPLYAT